MSILADSRYSVKDGFGREALPGKRKMGEQFYSPTLFFGIWTVPSLRLTTFQPFLLSQFRAQHVFSPRTSAASRSTFLSVSLVSSADLEDIPAQRRQELLIVLGPGQSFQ